MKNHSNSKTNSIRAHKGNDAPLVCLTAYTAPMAAILAPHCDILLVGDTIGMVLYGMDSTRGVTLDIMIAHGQAVMRRRGNTCVIIDMPFGTYEDSPAQAFENAKRLVDETGCDGVKIEGGQEIAPTIEHLVQNGIPVMAHIGLLPQSVTDGKFRVQGKSHEQVQRLLTDARAIEKAGAFSVVIEATIEPVAAQLTQELNIPTIGIGASASCDGQILVTDDMLGLLDSHTPKFVKQYADLKSDISAAVQRYATDVKARTFPGADQTYSLSSSPEKEKKAS